MRGVGVEVRLPSRGQGGLCRGTAVSSVVAVLLGLCLSTTARAVCTPDPATSGQTVTCSGIDVDGFQAGVGVNSLTVNVLTGATVNDNGTAAISVNDLNVVTNNGTITVASGLTGISAGSNNTITNNAGIVALDNGIGIQAVNNNTIANNGTIATGDFGVAITVFDNNTVTNSGSLITGASSSAIFAGANSTITNTATGIITALNDSNAIFVAGNSTVTNAGSITIGDAAALGAGISAINDHNTITNTATGTITVGDNSFGVFMQGNFAVVSNAGTIKAGQFGGGIAVFGDDATVTNDNSIKIADFGAAIGVQGDRATITQNGTLTVGFAGAGIAYAGSSGTITNTKTISGGDSAEGIFVTGDGNTVTNRGTINVGDGGAGIDVSGSGVVINQIVNTGTITVGNGGVGIFVSGGGNVFNSGTINAGTGTAIEFCNCANNTLTLGPGSRIFGQVIGAGTDTLQLGGTGNDSFSLSDIGAGQQYDGFTTFNKVDSSNWTVNGIGNQDWTVLGGTFTVQGVIFGNVTVAAGGTLSGEGEIGNAIINGGTLAPGSPTGTFTVNGSLSMTTASTYMVQISGANNGFAAVAGTATLNGATVVAVPVGTIQKHYTILFAAGGVVDTFNPVVAGLSPNLHATLSYDPNNVFLDFALNYGTGLNINQQNVANALTRVFNTTGSIPVALANLTSQGLTQASGEPGTGSQQATFNAMNLFLGLLTDPFSAGRGGGTPGATPFAEEASANAYASTGKSARDAFASIYRKAPAADFDQRWSVWAAGYGGSQTTDGNAALGSNSTTSSVYGTAVGFDYRFSPSTIAGVALAGGATNFGVNGLGWGHSDLFQAGAFVRHNSGPAYITAALAYGWQDVTTNRVVTAAGYDQLRAQFNANAFSGRVEGGYRYVTPWMGVTPYAAVQATNFNLPNYAENAVVGTNAFALGYAGKSVTDTRTELGLRSDRSFAASNGVVTLRGRVAWAHDFNPDRTIGAVFQTLPGSAFVVNGAALSRDSALTTASVEMKWMNGWSAIGTFEGEFSNVTRSYAGKGIVRYAW
ncbi:autotransporter domain-containing protein [Bradyrhizobium manausense]|uniref:autotransporter outer membrane beta-barrel domain-containing protein n=1 Tax=Bradyrhizobium TaxID=374 RepID=UPI001BAD4FD6|nr:MULTISPECIES: autotransporter domain-containing protein [Bradyrhizobium]MBR0829315.1 autotransporter domain-containing protein [Bradyrhizobium manausense]UVO29763.1 autotransporter domain-containing protein [Bradyrhizobium arachidis]